MNTENIKKTIKTIRDRKQTGDIKESNAPKLPGENLQDVKSEEFNSVSQDQLYDAVGGARPGSPEPPH